MGREKVIVEIEDALSGNLAKAGHVYKLSLNGLKDKALIDALAMLKEQEAVEPITMQRVDGNFSFFVPYYLCGNCRYELVGKDVMFCSHCGQAVKWDE